MNLTSRTFLYQFIQTNKNYLSNLLTANQTVTDAKISEMFTRKKVTSWSNYQPNGLGNQYQLLETLLLKKGQYYLFDEHLNRLQNSAKYFNIPININKIITLLMDVSNNQVDLAKVRLLINEQGEATIECEQISPTPEKRRNVMISKQPIDRNNIFHYHKTTNRQIYDIHRNQITESIFDVLLWNNEREITEFTIGNIVLEKDGKKFTPPIACGVLPGTLRKHLLKEGKVIEKRIDLDELHHYSTIWLINSVRGWINVNILDD